MSGTTISQTYTFLPTKIPGCQLWFDAADSTKVTLSGSKVTQWTDKSSNAYFVTQPTAAAQPTYTSNVQNGLAGIQFGGGLYLYQDGSNIPNFSSGSTASVFITARNASTNASWNIINTMWFDVQAGGTTRYHFSFNQGATPGTTLYASGTLTGQVTSNAVAPSGNAILGFTTSPTSSSVHTNGSSNSYGGKTLTAANNNTDFMFNDARGNDFGANIIIFEMVGYNTQVTESERQQIEGYMAWKWGLQANLPATHPYKKFPPFMNSLTLPATLTAPIPANNNNRFLPTQFSGCSLWLDAADTSSMTFSSGKISQWNDKSGNSRNVSQASSGAQPPLSNGGVYFNYGALVYNGSLGMNGVFTGYIVNRAIDTPTFQRMIDVEDNNKNVVMIDNTQISIMNNGTGFGTSFNAFLNQTMMFGWNMNVSSAQYGLNGSNFVTLPSGYQRNNAGTSITVGNAVGGTGVGGFRGYIYEIVFYNTLLNTNQRQQLEGYLAWKWGIQGSMPSTQPYKAPLFLKSASWIPTRISGCSLWLDAADTSTITLVGTAVSQWNDKSGNNRNFTQTTAASRPTQVLKVLNSLPNIQFSSQYMSNSGFALYNNASSGCSFFTVFNTTNINQQSCFLSQTWNGQNYTESEFGFSYASGAGYSLANYGSIGFHRGNGAVTQTSSNTISANTTYIYSGIAGSSGTTPTSISLLLNGTQYTSVDFSSGGSNGYYSPGSYPIYTNGVYIGARNDRGPINNYMNGNFAEIILYNTSLSTAQRQQVEGYLAWKWGLQANLPNGHPFKLFPPSP